MCDSCVTEQHNLNKSEKILHVSLTENMISHTLFLCIHLFVLYEILLCFLDFIQIVFLLFY